MARHKDPFSLSSSVRIKKKSHSIVIDNVPLQERTSRGPQETIHTPLQRKRFVVGALLCLAILTIFFIRVLSLQSNAEGYLLKADENRIRIFSRPAPRGALFDRHGVALTQNSPDVGVFLTKDDFPSDAAEQQHIFSLLASYTEKTVDEISSRYNEIQGTSSIEPLPLVEHITHEQSIKLSVHAKELPGIQLRPQILREYMFPQSLAHVLGYVGKMTEAEWASFQENPRYVYNDTVGKTGIEKSYESMIKGENGKERVEVDALGHVTSVVASEAPIPGQNITLTIDAEFQQFLYDELAKATQGVTEKGGAAVAINPQNGEVLALVSWPSFDANSFNLGLDQSAYQALLTDPKKPLFNKSISGEYPSGSTIKPLIAAAALEEGLVTPQTTVLSTGGIQVSRWSFPDWKPGGHGVTNLRKAIAESVNTYFYAIGGGWEDVTGLGVDRIRSYAERFGLNKELGIDIEGEADGFLPTKEWKEETKGEPWYIGDTYHLAIGQGDLLVTPLQISSYISVIANGGTLYAPHVVKKIGDEEQGPTTLNEQVVSTRTIQSVQAGMRDTVLSGSARSLQSVPMEVAAKTGTAQFGSGDKYHAWFTAFAPYKNPSIALTILIEEGGEGSAVAAPVAHRALSWWAEHRQ